jgi:hypothetical protein
MRATLTILCLLWTVPAYTVDTLNVKASDPVLEDWRWTTFDKSDGLAGRVNRCRTMRFTTMTVDDHCPCRSTWRSEITSMLRMCTRVVWGYTS